MDKINFKEKMLNFLKKLKNSFILVSKGEEKFNIMLYIWGIIPALLITFFFQKKINFINNAILQISICSLISIYFIWHILSIKKTLKMQPQYKIVKPSKKKLYKDKTKEEINEIKKEKRKETFQKFLLLKAWDSSPNYILAGAIDAYVLLTQLQILSNFIK